MTRTYDLVHRTTYTYPAPVTDCYGRTTMTPRDLPGQAVIASAVEVDPAPGDTSSHIDYYGNRTTYYGVTSPHTTLVVTSRSTIEINRVAATLEALPVVSWEDTARSVEEGDSAAAVSPDVLVALRELVLPSTHVRPGPEVEAWAAPSFTPGRALGDVLVDLAHRIRTEITYKSGSTTVNTTQAQLLAQRAGVCQDFAHLMIAALRTHGLPARYVSGYIETQPPPGREKLRGADASHAWLAAWVPGAGWVDIDPTNDQFVDDRYVVLGWGRDYHDVPPLRGVIYTEGSGSRLTVQVDLVPTGAPRFE